MEVETVDPPARWIVQRKTVNVPHTDPAKEATTREVYYWKLNKDMPLPAFDPPRFYLMKPMEEILKYWSSPEDSDYWLIPQGYVDTYIEGIPVSRRFPDVALQLSDAYGLDGKPREKKVKTKSQLKEMLETTMEERHSAMNKLSANDINYHAYDEGVRCYFTFDSFDPPSIDHEYVKLSDKDLRLMNTSGGIEQPEEVYILVTVVDQFASRNDNGHSFAIRTEDGTPKMFHMKDSVSVTQEEWAARKNRAINSIDGGGGWTRMINPELTLYLVPVSPDWCPTLRSIMESIKTAKLTPVKCLQTWQIYETSDELLASRIGTHDAPAFKKVFILILNQDVYMY